MPLGAGLDVGGTKIAACVADVLTGRIFASEQVPSATGSGGPAVLASAVSLVKRLAAGREVATVGVGICELVDLDHHIASAYTVDWRGLDVEGAFSEIAPARLESDVRAAALAEARW
jgi:glucokinase